MPLSSAKRAWIAIAVIFCVVCVCTGVYLYRQHRPLPGANAGQAPDILSQLPADAPVVAYVDVAALRAQKGSALLSALGLDAPMVGADRDYEEFVRNTGFDYTKDLDRSAAALWPAALGNTTNALGQNRVLAIALGRFDEQKIKAYALRTGKSVARGTHSIYEVPGNPPVSFEFLEPTRMVLAGGIHADDLVADLRSTPRDPVMQARIERVAGAPIFAVARADNLPESFYSNFKNAPQLERLARSVRGLTLAGRPDGENIKVALDGECDSMKSAVELATILSGFRMLGAMALSDPNTLRKIPREQAAFLEALIRNVNVTHQDNWVRLTLDITPEMLGVPRSSPPRRSALSSGPSAER